MADTKQTEGSWKFSYRGTRKTALIMIEQSAEVPQAWKAVLAAEVAMYPPTVEAVRVDAHCHFSNGKKVLHADIQSLF